MLFRRQRSTIRALPTTLALGVAATFLIAAPSRGQGPTTPTYFRENYTQKLRCDCTRDCVPTSSGTSPLSGNQSFTVPITSWSDHGATFPFALTYNSLSTVDPHGPPPPEFAGLSERNPKWSHTYAQWIDLAQDQTSCDFA